MAERPRVERVRDVFEDWASRGRAEGMAESHTPFVRPVFDRLPLEAGARYLDIGCGNGYTVCWAAERVGPAGEAVGIDVAPGMIARAGARCGDRPSVRFHVATFPDDHPLPAEHFDVVFSMEVFYYLPDLKRALSEVRALLVPGGQFACQVDYYEENRASHAWPADVGVAMTPLSARGWREAFESVGLVVTEQFRVRLPADAATDAWQSVEGSLATIGRRRP